MTLLYKDNAECSGCGACKDVCAKSAISMIEDELGFRYPQIDYDMCVNCGRCLAVCPLKGNDANISDKKSYIAVSNNEEQLKRSSSGGIFPLLAEKIIANGGFVAGAEFYETANGQKFVRHRCISDTTEILKLQNSKYIQSDTTGIYKTVKEHLDENKTVLFTGTPCQIFGLYKFLGKEYRTLYTAEVICHGVPSAKIFHSYIDFLEKKLDAKITDLCFRDKTKGWGKRIKITYVNKSEKTKTKIIPSHKSSLFTLFLKGDVLRESCHKCRFASENRAADITMGDFWGIRQEYTNMLKRFGGVIDETKGVSCIIVNNSKGYELLEHIKNDADFYPSDYDLIAKYNNQIKVPLPIGKNRDKAIKIYLNDGYEALDEFAKKNYRMKDSKSIIRIAVTDFLKGNRLTRKMYQRLKSLKRS